MWPALVVRAYIIINVVPAAILGIFRRAAETFNYIFKRSDLSAYYIVYTQLDNVELDNDKLIIGKIIGVLLWNACFSCIIFDMHANERKIPNNLCSIQKLGYHVMRIK